MTYTPPQMATAIVTIMSLSVGGTWYLRQERIDVLEEKLATYQSFEKIDFPKLSQSIAIASDELSKQIQTMASSKELAGKYAEAHQLNMQLEKANTELRGKNESLEERLRSLILVDQEFTVREGNSHKFLKDNFSVGVTSVLPDTARITFNNEILRVTSGEHRSFVYMEKPCRLTMDSINFSNSSVLFSINCPK